MGGPAERCPRAFDVEAQRSAARRDADAARGCVAPCWDETDNGIPDVCLERRWCPFNPDNPVTNDNFVCHVFGNIGFPYFDRTRKRYMGVAMWSTLLAMFVTAFGALSLSTDPDVVRASYWLKLEAVNGTAGGATAKYYLGLRSVVTVRGGGDESTDRLEQDFYVGAIPGSDSRDPVQREVLDACAAGAAGNQIGALLSCVTLIFALLGTINRMRFSSDANVQKALGLVTDTWGAATLTWTLVNFHFRCFAGLPARHGALELEHAWGPAWVCYLVCCLSGIIRAAAHWVTPTPGNGAGACVFSLPARILRVLEADLGDALSYAEQKRTYKLLRAAMAEEGHVVNAFVRESLAKVSGALRDAAGGVENAVAALVGDARRATGVAGPEANGGLDDAALRVALTVAKLKLRRGPAKRDLFEGSGRPTMRGDLAGRAVRAASMPSLLLGLVDERHPPEPVRVQPSFGAGDETRPPEGA